MSSCLSDPITPPLSVAATALSSSNHHRRRTIPRRCYLVEVFLCIYTIHVPVPRIRHQQSVQPSVFSLTLQKMCRHQTVRHHTTLLLPPPQKRISQKLPYKARGRTDTLTLVQKIKISQAGRSQSVRSDACRCLDCCDEVAVDHSAFCPDSALKSRRGFGIPSHRIATQVASTSQFSSSPGKS
jgi:hypothetical protein